MNLTTLANVRAWVGSQPAVTTDDALLTRLIAEASRLIMNYLCRAELGLTTITETISGRGTQKVQLSNWPVIAVNSLSINGVSVPASTGPTIWGYAVEPYYGSSSGNRQNLGIVGSGCGGAFPLIGTFPNGGVTAYRNGGGIGSSRPFNVGQNNILIDYSYGYSVQNEAQTIPADSPYQIIPASVFGALSKDLGVTVTVGGQALESKPPGTELITGQYIAPQPNAASPTNYYTFAAADEGKAVLLNYDYVPYDVEQACIEVVGERYRYKARIGQISQSMGGQETSSYMVNATLTPSIKGRLDNYRLIWR